MQSASKAEQLSAKDAKDAAECADAMLDGLPMVMWFIRRRMRRHRTGGLSVPQFRALCLLDRSPTASLSIVAEHLGSSQPSASRLITGLVSRGLVKREESADDRRQIQLVLTSEGKAVHAASQKATRAALAAEIAQLSPAQRTTITSAMRLLHDVFESAKP
jgi:DNA-binding MarR family transcriptional regulator